MSSRYASRIQLDGRKCVDARRRRGLSRSALVDLAEPGFPISEATVKRAERGAAIHLEKAGTLARLLGVALEELLPQPEAPRGGRTAGQEALSAAIWAEEPGLVGREREMALLDRTLRDALAGRPRILLIEGEAGIGKTRLLAEARLRFARRGFLCASGGAYEQGSLPFEAIGSALRPLVERLATRCEDPPALSICLDDASRARLSGADNHLATISRLLRSRRPIFLAVDDLQWADRGSLELLGVLVMALCQTEERGEPVPLAIAAGIRSDPPATLTPLLESLRSEPICTSMVLRPLDEPQTYELLVALGLAQPSGSLVSRIQTATGGNPLFVRETLAVLRMREQIVERGGSAVTALTAEELALPETITGAIEARLRTLSERCRQTLVRAAFLGGRFDLGTLSVVLEEDEETVLDQLEEAVGAGFLHNERDDFDFAHPLVRHVLYCDPIPARRMRIHREIAERLEGRYGSEDAASVLEIADHLIRAGPVAGTERLLRSLRLAADQAFERSAWQDAARFCEALLSEGRRRGVLSDREVAELHRRSGVALHRCWEAGPSLVHYDEAIAAFERTNDPIGAARALNDRVRLADNLGLVAYGELGDVAALERALERIGDGDLRLRGQLLDTLAMCYATARQPERAEALAHEALRIGLAEEDHELCAQVSTSIAFSLLQRLRVREARERWELGAQFARRAGDRLREGRCLQRLPMALFALGRLSEAQRAARDAFELTEMIPNSGESSLPRASEAAIALVQGDLAAAERLARDALGILRRRRYAWVGPTAFATLAQVLSLRGEAARARETIQRMIEPGVVFEDPRPLLSAAKRYRWLVDAAGGSPVMRLEVRAQLHGAGRSAPSKGRFDLAAVTRLCAEIELADALGAPELAAHAYEPLRGAVAQGVRLAGGWVNLVPRILGVAACGAQRFAAAREHFDEALRFAEAEGATLELGRCCLDYARSLDAEGTPEAGRRSRALAKRAVAIFESIGAPGLAETAKRLV